MNAEAIPTRTGWPWHGWWSTASWALGRHPKNTGKDFDINYKVVLLSETGPPACITVVEPTGSGDFNVQEIHPRFRYPLARRRYRRDADRPRRAECQDQPAPDFRREGHRTESRRI